VKSHADEVYSEEAPDHGNQAFCILNQRPSLTHNPLKLRQIYDIYHTLHCDIYYLYNDRIQSKIRLTRRRLTV
jgi:hypothetical protein